MITSKLIGFIAWKRKSGTRFIVNYGFNILSNSRKMTVGLTEVDMNFECQNCQEDFVVSWEYC